MRVYLLAPAFLTCVLFCPIGSADEIQEPAIIDVSGELTAIIEEHDLPGMAVLVLQGDRIVAQGAGGVRRRGSNAAIELDDKFHIGSDGKAITATLCAILVEEGKLRWDSTVGEVLAKYKRRMHPAWREVTLKDLLVHRGGAPGDVEPALWSRLFVTKLKPVAARGALMKGVFAKPPVAKPGTTYIYSNVGYTIAGHMAEVVSAKPYETLMAERIFEPLGMASAGFGAPGKPRQLDQPLGHRADGEPVEPGPQSDNPPAIAPAGTMHFSLADWARFIALHINGESNGKKLLTKESIQTLQTPVGEYAMGWIVLDRSWAGNGPALTHSGSNTMWRAVAWLAPAKHFAVLVATNQDNPLASKACNDVATAMIQRFCPK